MLLRLFRNDLVKKNFYFLILFVLFVWFICQNVDVAFMLFAAIIFACSLSPMVDKLSKKMSRGLATTIVVTGMLLLMAIFIVPILLLGAYQITEFAIKFPTYVEHLGDFVANSPAMHKLGINNFDVASLADSIANSSSYIIGSTIELTRNISSAFLYIFTSIIFLFIFLIDKDVIKEYALKLMPSEVRKKTGEMLDNVGEKLGGYVMAQALVSGSVWVTMTIGLLLFNIDYAWILGLIAGVLSIIPVVGSALSLVICLIATYHSGLQPMIIVTVMFTISHFIENHVVRPYIYSKLLQSHPLIIFLALFIGGKYAGVVGVLLAPPFAVALSMFLEELYIKRMDK